MLRPRSSLVALALLVPPALAAVLTVEPSSPAATHGLQEGDRAKSAEAEARKKQKVEDLMDAMGQKDLMKKSVDQMLDTFTEMGLPEDFGEKFKERFDLDEILAMSVEVYCEHLEEGTVDAMIAFYATEEGKKLAAALPDITLECMKKGQEYGKTVAADIMREK